MNALSTISIVVIETVSDANAEPGRAPERHVRAQDRTERERVAEDERERDRHAIEAALPQPSAVAMTMPSTSPIAQPVRQCVVA